MNDLPSAFDALEVLDSRVDQLQDRIEDLARALMRLDDLDSRLTAIRDAVRELQDNSTGPSGQPEL